MKITVKQGRVVLNSIIQVVDHDDVKIYEIDLVSKYAEVSALSWSGGDGTDSIGVVIGANGDTLNVDKSTNEFTEIIIEAPAEESWRVEAGIRRYTGYIFVYRVDGEYKHIWERTEKENERS